MKPKQSFNGVDGPADGLRTGGGWAFPALLVVVLLAAGWFARRGPEQGQAPETSVGIASSADWAPTPQPQGETVGLTIDFGNGAKKQFDALPWHEGMTLAELMLEAAQFRPGIAFTQHGEGETGLLTSIDGLKNQGVSDRNWRYEVNGQYGQTSFCLQRLDSGDRVLWKFAEEE